MSQNNQINAWKSTAEVLGTLLNSTDSSPWRSSFEKVLHQAEINNPWFTPSQLKTAFTGIIKLLEQENLEKWIHQYPAKAHSPKKVGVIMAGNIPMAGFHDLLCVLLSGNQLVAKLSSSDQILLPFVAELFLSFLPSQKPNIIFADQLKGVHAVIATGSNNSARYFEYYFGKQPHIFRKNRNSAAVISGTENEYDFILLGRDIFTYYGLGCRNVSKLYVPEGYDFSVFFENMIAFGEVMQHNKYMNNFDYHQALYLMNREEFLTNNFVIIKKETALASPVSVLHFENYSNEEDLGNKLKNVKNELQCIVSKTGPVQFGQAQFPAIDDYADGVDTMAFLSEI